MRVVLLIPPIILEPSQVCSHCSSGGCGLNALIAEANASATRHVLARMGYNRVFPGVVRGVCCGCVPGPSEPRFYNGYEIECYLYGQK